MCNVAAGQPFDTVKLRTQTAAVGAVDVTILGALRSVIARDGVIALWRGALPAVSSALVENAVVFTVNGALKRALVAPGNEPTTLQHFLIGGLSGVFSATAICGPEVIKVRAQHRGVEGLERLTPARALAQLLRAEGPMALFTGLTPLLARDVPFNALFFGFYELYSRLGRAALNRRQGSDLPSWTVVLAGGAAGSSAWTIVFPADTVKSRMQTAALSSQDGTKSAGAALKATLQQGGIRALYRGWGAAVLRAFPANGALFLGVETTSRLLRPASDNRR